MRRLDRFMNLPIKQAIEKRKEKAKLLLELDKVARKAVEKVKELGISHPFLYREVISFCNPIGRKRNVEESMEEVFTALKRNLEKLIDKPEMIRQHKFSEIEI